MNVHDFVSHRTQKQNFTKRLSDRHNMTNVFFGIVVVFIATERMCFIWEEGSY